MQPNPAHGADQDVGEGCQPQTQLVRAHRGGRCAIGIEIKLTLLEAILHLAPGPVEFFLEVFGFASCWLQQVNDEARIAFALVNSALPMTRRRRLQLRRVLYMNSLKNRAGFSVRRLFASARASSPATSATNRLFCCNPKRKCTELASHQAISSSRAKPLSARNMMRTFAHRSRICATMRATSSTAPAAASTLAARSLAANKWRPQNTYSGR